MGGGAGGSGHEVKEVAISIGLYKRIKILDDNSKMPLENLWIIKNIIVNLIQLLWR
ncbi:MAG: hypothetical protein ACLRJA_19860 [Blautia producta]